MVLPVGGFFPIPLAMMIPFMATQSLIMGESFGKGFQFGKRKISAMDNASFNKLTMEQVASEMFQSYNNILPNLKQSIADSADFQNHIFAQLILLGPNLISALSGAVLQPSPGPTAHPGPTGKPIPSPPSPFPKLPGVGPGVPPPLTPPFQPPIPGTSGAPAFPPGGLTLRQQKIKDANKVLSLMKKTLVDLRKRLVFVQATATSGRGVTQASLTARSAEIKKLKIWISQQIANIRRQEGIIRGIR